MKFLFPESSDESHESLIVLSSSLQCYGQTGLVAMLVVNSWQRLPSWTTPCSRVEQEQQVMRYPTPLLICKQSHGLVGRDSDAESCLEHEILLGGVKKAPCGSCSGFGLQDIWFPISASEFLHVLGQIIQFTHISFPQWRTGDCVPPARCCEAPWSWQLP